MSTYSGKSPAVCSCKSVTSAASRESWRKTRHQSAAARHHGLLSEQQRRPYASLFPNLGSITWLETAANSQYNSFQSSLRSTSYHGFTGQISWTLAHARDDMSYARYAEPENSYCLKCDYGNSDFDIRSNASAYAIYDVPNFIKSKPRIGGGWQLNAIFVVHTGTPFSVTTGTNVSNSFGGGDQ